MARGNDRSTEVSKARGSWLVATYALQVLECVELRAQSSVYTQELLVHDSGEGKRAESVHAGFVDSLGVLVLAFELEGEVVGQMATFVVTTKQPKCVGIPDLQRPQVQHALLILANAHWLLLPTRTSILKYPRST